MSFDGIKGLKIIVEKDGHNETVANTHKYRIYVEDKLVESFRYYSDLKKRLSNLLDGFFGEEK